MFLCLAASGHMHWRSQTRAAFSTFPGPVMVRKLLVHVVMAMSSLDTLLKGSTSVVFKLKRFFLVVSASVRNGR